MIALTLSALRGDLSENDGHCRYIRHPLLRDKASDAANSAQGRNEEC